MSSPHTDRRANALRAQPHPPPGGGERKPQGALDKVVTYRAAISLTTGTQKRPKFSATKLHADKLLMYCMTVRPYCM